MTLILGFGIMFQLPVVLTLLAQAGILGAQSLRDFRRYAIVAITALAGVLSPPDPFSMIAMALPTILLYEAGILRVDGWRSSAAAKAAAAQQAAPSYRRPRVSPQGGNSGPDRPTFDALHDADCAQSRPQRP